MWDFSKPALLAGLVILSLIFWWLPSALMTPAIHLTGLYHLVPDYYIDHFEITEMGTNGQAKYVLAAEKMVHYPHEQRTELLSPRLTEFGPDEVTRSYADKGWISHNGKQLLMLGHVHIDRSRNGQSSGAHIVTQRIQILLR